jgi:hypothetical protein
LVLVVPFFLFCFASADDVVEYSPFCYNGFHLWLSDSVFFFLTLEHHGQHRMRIGAVQFVEISNNTPSGSDTERADRMVSRGTGVRAAVHGSTGASSAAGYK